MGGSKQGKDGSGSGNFEEGEEVKDAKVYMMIGGNPIMHSPSQGVYYFTAGMTIDADGSPRAYHPNSKSGLDYLENAGKPGNWWGIATQSDGSPYIQGIKDPAPGFYVSTTSLKNPGFKHGDPRREIDSEKVPFIVMPLPFIRKVPGAVLGCRAQIIDTKTNTTIECVVADAGPSTHLGEASIAAAKQFKGINADARRGGTTIQRFRYLVWPGQRAPGFELMPLSKS